MAKILATRQLTPVTKMFVLDSPLIAEAAKAAGLEVKTIDGVDDVGLDHAGKPVADISGGPDLLKAAFASDVGVDNDTVATRDGGYVWFEVNAIDPARQKTFEEVKSAVLEAMRAEAAQKVLGEKAEEAANKIRGGQSIDDVAKGFNVDVKRATNVKREARPDIPSNAIVAFFDVAPHGAGT